MKLMPFLHLVYMKRMKFFCFLLFVPFTGKVFSQQFSVDMDRVTVWDKVSKSEPDVYFRFTEFAKDGYYNPFIVYKKKEKDSVILFEAEVNGLILNGQVKYYNENGLLTSRSTYKNTHTTQRSPGYEAIFPYRNSGMQLWGMKEGKEEIYYSNEQNKKGLQLFRTCTYTEGKLNGLMLEYFENGNIMRSTEWKNGEKEGAYFDNYEGGEIRNMGHYHKYEQHNWWMTWYPNGTLKAKIKYVNGYPDTAYRYYNGGKIKSINYRSGYYPEKPSYVYDSLGRLMKFAYMNRQLEFDSIEVEYYDGVKKKMQANVKNGKWEGGYNEWYENGKLKVKGQYKNDSPIGKWHYYDEKGKLINTKERAYKPIETTDAGPYAEIMEEPIFTSVHELPEFIGGRTQAFKKTEYKLPKGIKKIELSGKCSATGEMVYTVKTKMSKKDLERLQAFLEKKYNRIQSLKINGKSYNCVIEMSLLFD